MTIEEAGPDPVRLAAAIHEQLTHFKGHGDAQGSACVRAPANGDAGCDASGPKRRAVPVVAVAQALDIVEIRVTPLKSLEGALLFPADRNVGSVILNSASSPRRRRYTLAHELCRFLNLWHEPFGGDGGSFACARSDLSEGWRPPGVVIERRLEQEIEANRFAIELLAPRHLMRRHLHGVPDLARILAAADALDLSREAAARRYVELHAQPCAVAFAENGRLRYAEWASNFPPLHLRKGDPLPPLPRPGDAGSLSDHEDADPRDWLRYSRRRQNLVVQVLSQADGYATVLLMLDEDEEGEGEDNQRRMRSGDQQ